MANAGFQNYRPRQTFWYIETNVVLRRPPTPISKLLFEPYLLHYKAIHFSWLGRSFAIYFLQLFAPALFVLFMQL